MMRLIPRLAVLVPSNTAEQSATEGSQAGENHIADESAAAGSEESVDAAALFPLHVPSSRVAVATSAAAAAATSVSALVLFVVVPAVVVVFAPAVD